MNRLVSIAILTAILFCNASLASAESLVERTWSDALKLSNDWNIGAVTLTLDESEDVYVTSASSVVVGRKFLDKLGVGTDANNALLFALLHELWHVHQIRFEGQSYGTMLKRPQLECAADARAAFTLARRIHATLGPESTDSEREAVAQGLATIVQIPFKFPILSDGAAERFQHLGTQKRRFSALAGVLQGLSSDSARMPEKISAGLYGKLRVQTYAFWAMNQKTGLSDQDKLNYFCSFVVNNDTEKFVQISPLSFNIIKQNGQRFSSSVYKITNLQDVPVRYTFLSLDGVVDKNDDDQDLTNFTSIRRTYLDISARGTATLQAYANVPAIDSEKFKYLPPYSLGFLDRVDIAGASVPPAACFDDMPKEVANAMDTSTKLAIRIGQAAITKFEGVRGDIDNLYSSADNKVYRFSFDLLDQKSGKIEFLNGVSYATLDLYNGDDQDEALKILDRIEAYAKKSCPTVEDPAFSFYIRSKDRMSLDIAQFVLGSSATVTVTMPDENYEDKIRVFWMISRKSLED